MSVEPIVTEGRYRLSFPMTGVPLSDRRGEASKLLRPGWLHRRVVGGSH
jgi:hypothetical protein